ncbi:MAG: YjbQ family protein [Clostridiales bacterium]|nr:YjbQ family protein [Clostridiales bacterium]
MKNLLFQYSIPTKSKQEFIDITEFISQSINESGVKNGHVLIYCPHTTAGITINENADPNVIEDMINALDNVFPIDGNYKHIEGNAHAHLKSSFIGSEKSIIILEGEPLLGTWQSVYFCEFDGPRSRKLFIKIMKD